MELVQALAVIFTFSLAVFFAGLGVKILIGNKSEYERNRDRSPGFKRIMRGEVSTLFDQGRDHRVAAGIARDRNKGCIVRQGRLSEDSVNNATHP